MKAASSTPPERTALTFSAVTISKVMQPSAPGDAGEEGRDDQRQPAHLLRVVADELGALGIVAHRVGDAPERRVRPGVHQRHRGEAPERDQVVDLIAGPEGQAEKGWPNTRLVVMPPSPPKKSGTSASS
jgi:hypothetical protein